MARVTVEDCTLIVPNRFDLVILASQRTRQISAGALLEVERDNDKNPVVALREIADEHIDPKSLQEAVINSFRRHVEVEPQEEEFAELFSQETISYLPEKTEEGFQEIDEEEDEEESLEIPEENISLEV